MDSILETIKKLLGIPSDYTNFDEDLKVHINTTINLLYQLGVPLSKGFLVVNDQQTWDELIGVSNEYDLIKTYIYLRVRMLFDPPTGAVAESFKETIKELEWRITVRTDDE